MGSLDPLMQVQELDTAADRLRHQRSTLPEAGLIETAEVARTASVAHAEVIRGRLHDLRHAQKALEDEAASVEEKAQGIDRKLYDGSVVAHKELEAFQADHRMLKARQGELEDRAIELMEAAEPVETELAGLDAEVSDHDARIEDLRSALAAATSEIDEELGRLSGQRDDAAAEVPAEVLTAYEATRVRMGGIGAARLVGNRCEGCHLQIPSAELEQVRHAADDAIVTCPECGRILVR